MTASIDSALEGRLRARLVEGLKTLEIAVSPGQVDHLVALVVLLHKWNRAYNLTAVRDPLEMVSRHLLDSAAVLPWVEGPRILDVGAGPGLPGLVLAILRPDLDISLLDSNGKKVRFQRQAVMELGLTRVTPIQARVESFAPPAGGYDQLISRAFASLEDFIGMTRSLLAPGGQWLAMKGPAVDGELERLDDDIRVLSRHPLRVPFADGGRELVMLEPDAGDR
ncbi:MULTISPECIES: 16S rRNA (guanine(527)-N(7))-methyltransferase RsmG [Halomonas]|uniref:16S rRNA (guanine(527)-N(7))-methyltransferase RsmG n=1 Tax=Halomonas TaxID=2745 RepID=UPI001A8DCFBE|nr:MULTISPECIES: 16S rRNA (guanine(527)-N(7))-methyltransferase RsmG [Halomonas]MED5297431.1 16S rRNA (guanine(527)-N(7))-methyltransferase RsmG [Pseudomonadota bacterium]MBN8412789.1 16S rRNA (guanine(527)-N(7))-methyltransferase RsmG [Halomonas litopenaei]MBY5925084.1 16S rRNA (guanine(527)-N(7))-methyltransferase RsmG [Halomonas sp. DP4Y7-2]MBY6206312.1 16S rRNA (guanine(527)-N(7))-methyltransferase RsmG [Halomonas sp. DP3Y7-2]MBY6227797.1 16S rRNA (guanine(527)-N(7))-methyltransferase RsmG